MVSVKRSESLPGRWRRNRRNHAGQVRIIAGEWRGRRVAVATRPQLRPTPNRLRETLFNWLGDSVRGCRVLDLYAGTGILGFESLSRGAEHATFVENDRRTLVKLREACQQFDLEAAQAAVVEANAVKWLERNQALWDLVFLDPPFYAIREYRRVLRMIASHLSDNGMVYVESASRSESVSCPLDEWKSKEIGEVRIQLFRRPLHGS
ncbi:MAG: 16S rRNA (guanine(966)-N(2))-methyltransferase RsmD [Gammaproteobacteria bacterium]|nr:16S rRNA (guanine(966)-N(2))-methyltransferase RsmD [Gammaproteobacteria bacterium]